MNTPRHPYGPLKTGPALAAREPSCAGVAERLGARLLICDYVDSSSTARTTKNSTGVVGVVVMPAHPCGEQQSACGHSSEVERWLYTPLVGGSIPSARTNRMRSAASESRQLHAGVMVKRVFHMDYAIGSSPIIGTKLRRRQTPSVSHVDLAQWIEQHASNVTVERSNRSVDAMQNGRIQGSRISYVRVA